MAPITRAERADKGRPAISIEYRDKLRAFLEFVLAQYVNEGIGELDQAKLTQHVELRYHSISAAAKELDGMPQIRDAFIGFQRHLYQ